MCTFQPRLRAIPKVPAHQLRRPTRSLRAVGADLVFRNVGFESFRQHVCGLTPSIVAILLMGIGEKVAAWWMPLAIPLGDEGQSQSDRSKAENRSIGTEARGRIEFCALAGRTSTS